MCLTSTIKKKIKIKFQFCFGQLEFIVVLKTMELNCVGYNVISNANTAKTIQCQVCGKCNQETPKKRSIFLCKN